MSQPACNPRTARLIGAVLALATLALYLPALRHDFLAYDDQVYVTENFRVQAGLTGTGVVWAFGYHAGNWHPLTWLSHMADCQIYGLNPAGHHLTNVLLHAANTLLLFLVLNRMTGATWRCACVAALFAWHPLHVESVAWVAEQKDVLCALFWLLTMGAYAEYVQESQAQSPKSKVWYGGTLILFLLALMSKPMAVTLPFVLLLLDFWPLGRITELRRALLEKVPFFVLSAGACALTISAQQLAIVSTTGLPVSQRTAHALVSYLHYAGAMFVPRGLAVFYPYETTHTVAQVALAGIVLALVTLLAFRLASRRPYFVAGWFWFLGTLVPVIGLVQVGDQAWADRYTYLPLVGLFVCVVWAGADAVANRVMRRAVAAATAVALLVATTLQLRHWQNTRTLFEHAEQVTRNNLMAITMLGSLLAKEGKLDEAMERYRSVLRLAPVYPEAHFFLGHALDQQGKLDEAIAEYKQALWYSPVKEQTHVFLGAAFAKQGKYEEARAHYDAALKLNPDSAVTHNNLAKLLHTQGRLDTAIEHYLTALKLNPGLAQAHNNLGILLLQKGRTAEGAAQLREALRLNPGNAESQYNLALALNEQEQWGEAAELFGKTVSAASTDAKAHFQFAVALAHLQRTREAMSRYASALLLQPDFPDALDGLSWVLATDSNPELRNGTEAVRMAERACELTGRKDPMKLKTLAAAYAEAGRFPDAIAAAEAARNFGESAGRNEFAVECQLILESFKSAKPWRTSLLPP